MYIRFTKTHNIPDPCGCQSGYERIVACFIEQLIFDHNSCSAIVRGYVEAINTLFWLCQFDIPGDVSDQSNMCSKIILAREREKNVARQRSPITREMYSAPFYLAKKLDVDLLETVVADWFRLIRITGLHCSEYTQKTQSEVDEYEYPSGKCVVNAFTWNDWNFYNSKGHIIKIHTLTSKPQEFPMKLQITFRTQKNRKNGQSITLVANDDHPDICPVRAAYRIFLCTKKLGQSDSEPMGVFMNKHRTKQYFTGGKISDVLRSIARVVHSDLSKDKIKCFSSHSGRV